MSPAKNKTSAQKKSTSIKKAKATSSKTKTAVPKSSIKEKLNEFGDNDAL